MAEHRQPEGDHEEPHRPRAAAAPAPLGVAVADEASRDGRERGRDAGRHRAFSSSSARFASRLRPSVSSREGRQQERGPRRAAPSASARRSASAAACRDLVGVHRRRRRHGAAQQHGRAHAEPPSACREIAAASGGGVHPMREIDRRFPRQEEGQPVDAVPDDRDAELLEPLGRRDRVEIDFGPEQTSRPGVRANSSRSALTSGSGPGVHTADAAGRAHLMPARRRPRSSRSPSSRPSARATATGRSRRATFVAAPDAGSEPARRR